MHWFWRTSIALISGWVGGTAFYSFVWQAIYIFGYGHLYQSQFAISVVWMITFPVTALCGILPYATLTHLTARARAKALEAETRCRKCGYILRGITEPRCPECGERI